MIPLTQGELDGQAAAVAGVLTDRCRIDRASGTGASATWGQVATTVPYASSAPSPADLQVAPGALVAHERAVLEFRLTQDVRAEDRVTDLTTGERWTVRALIPPGSQAVRRRVLAEHRA